MKIEGGTALITFLTETMDQYRCAPSQLANDLGVRYTIENLIVLRRDQIRCVKAADNKASKLNVGDRHYRKLKY